jgi:3-hydroxyisobutyrate dehydrogenase-like beta-hydroxyacid dehydrogenase
MAFPRGVLDRSFNLGFAMGLMHKDVGLFIDEANAQGVPVWVNAAVAQMWRLAATELGEDADFSKLVTCVEAWAGVAVGKTNG